jgi:methyl-accepting chemotaxis protein
MERANKRKNYFIDKKFQIKFILRFSALVAIGGLLTIGIMYFLATQSTTVSIVNSRVAARTTAAFILPLLVQTVAIVVVAIGLTAIMLTLFFSHKIAGPLYRFKKVMQMLEKGDFSGGFKIRHLDQLQDLADTFNAMIARITSELVALKSNFSALKEKLNSISENEVAEHKRACLNELKKISEELNRIINYFKT